MTVAWLMASSSSSLGLCTVLSEVSKLESLPIPINQVIRVWPPGKVCAFLCCATLNKLAVLRQSDGVVSYLSQHSQRTCKCGGFDHRGEVAAFYSVSKSGWESHRGKGQQHQTLTHILQQLCCSLCRANSWQLWAPLMRTHPSPCVRHHYWRRFGTSHTNICFHNKHCGNPACR